MQNRIHIEIKDMEKSKRTNERPNEIECIEKKRNEKEFGDEDTQLDRDKEKV